MLEELTAILIADWNHRITTTWPVLPDREELDRRRWEYSKSIRAVWKSFGPVEAVKISLEFFSVSAHDGWKTCGECELRIERLRDLQKRAEGEAAGAK